MSKTGTSPRELRLSARGGRWSMIVYGAAHFGKSLFWYSSELLSAYYLTQILGLPGASMGLVIASGLLVGALLDPLVDLALRRSLANAHGAIALQAAGACLSAIAFPLMFLAGEVGPTDRLLYCMATGLAFRVAYSLYDQAQNALLSLSTTSSVDRTAVAGVRLALSGVAALAVAAIGTALASNAGSASSGGHFSFGTVACLISVCSIGTALVLLHFRGERPTPPVIELQTRRPFVARPASWLILVLAFASAATVPLFAKLQPYLTDFAQNATTWDFMVGAGVPLGGSISQPGWSKLSLRLNRMQVIRSASLLLVIAGLLFWVAAPVSAAAAGACSLLVGIGNGGIGNATWAAYGDAIDRAPGRLGWNFGPLTASLKLGLACGGAVLGGFLDLGISRASAGSQIIGAMASAPIAGGLLCMVLLEVNALHARCTRVRSNGMRSTRAIVQALRS